MCPKFLTLLCITIQLLGENKNNVIVVQCSGVSGPLWSCGVVMSHVIFAVTLYADFSYSTVYIPFRSSFPPGPFRIPQFCILSTPKSTLFKNSTCAIVHGWKIAPLHLIFMSVLYHTRKIVPVLYIYPSSDENNTKHSGTHPGVCMTPVIQYRKTSNKRRVSIKRRGVFADCSNKCRVSNKRRVSTKRRGVFVDCSNKCRGRLLEDLRQPTITKSL